MCQKAGAKALVVASKHWDQALLRVSHV